MIQTEKIQKGVILTTKEVTELLSISRPTLLKLRKDGHLKVHFYRTNGRPFFKGEDILNYLKYVSI